MSTRRYTTAIIGRAVAHREAGWSLAATGRLLEQEFGVKPDKTTILRWTDPAYLERAQATARARSLARWRAEHPPKPREVSDRLKLERMRKLHDRGLSFHAIGQVGAEWWGEEMTAEQVATMLRRKARRRSYVRRELTEVAA